MPDTCDQCGMTCKVFLCDVCKKAKYCSKVCQKTAWRSTHKSRCGKELTPIPSTSLIPSTPSHQGGAVYKVTDMVRVRRLIFCGNEGASTYYTKPSVLRREQATAVTRLLAAGQGLALLTELESISVSGRAAKQSNLLFVLAMCARFGPELVRQRAYQFTKTICRIPTALFEFLDLAKQLWRPAAAATLQKGGRKVIPQPEPGAKTIRQSPDMQGSGWGEICRREIAAWYNGKNPLDLAYLVTKYRNREGWTHRDVFRMIHIKPATPSHGGIVKYLCKGPEGLADLPDEKVRVFLMAVEKAKTANEEETCALIKTHRLAHEHISTGMLTSARVWETLFEAMPLTAFLRNLGRMTGLGLFSKPALVTEAVRRLRDEAGLTKARVHPFNILVALVTYNQGRGTKGSLVWTPVRAISTALDEAFYLAFKTIVPTGKRFVLGVDVSGSMDGGEVNGSAGITPRMAAAALAMVYLRTEEHCIPMAFSHTLVPLPLSKTMKLDEVCRVAGSIPMGGTYCDLPITWAETNRIRADVFVIFTDCENGRLKKTPVEALRDYRAAMGIPDAKLIVMAFTSAGFSIADPEDSNMLDMTGFDSAGPEIVSAFIRNEL